MDEKDTSLALQSPVGSTYIQSSDEDHGVDLRSYFLAILNRRWMILVITSLLVLGVGIYSRLETPVYRAKAVLEIDMPYSFGTQPATQPTYWHNRDPFMKTQFRLLKGKDLGIRVAEKLNLTLSDLTSNYGLTTKVPSKKAETNAVASRLIKMITVNPIPETNLCEILVTSPSPKLSKAVADAWGEEYVDQYVVSMQQYSRKAEELLTEQIGHLQKEISDKEKLLIDYSLKKQIVKPDKTRSLASYAVSDVNSALNDATRVRITSQVRHSALQSANKDSIPEVISHHSVQGIERQYAELEQAYREKSKTYKADYPEMIRLQSQLEQLLKSLEIAKTKAYQEVLTTSNSDLQRAYSAEAALQKQLDSARIKSVDAGRNELDYDKLVMEIENKKILMSSLLRKQNETGVSAQVQGKASTTRVIERAELPTSIFSPNIKKNMMFALLAGLFAGIGLAVAFEFFDRSIKSPDDVETILQMPFLGIVPRYAMADGNGHKNGGTRMLMRKKPAGMDLDAYAKDLLSANDPMSSASEAIKTVRTSFLLASPGSPPRSVLITSSRAGEGKTFIACNLAIALTQLDKRVVLVDTDMRNPRIHRIWNTDNNTGLSIYLTSDVPVSSVIRESSVNRLYYISSGPKTPRPAELLASARFDSLLEQLEREYDFVILDSPPVLPVADSVILASRAKGVLIVVYGGETPREVVRMAKKKLSASSGVIIGTILNGIDFTDPYYYYRFYSSYSYGYYGTDDPPSKHAKESV